MGVTTPMVNDDRTLKAQLSELKDLVGSRRIDAIVLSVGGNDIGFGNAIEALIAREYIGFPVRTNFGPEKAEIWGAVMDGQWASLENEVTSVIASKLTWGNDRIGLKGLSAQFDFLNQLIAQLGLNVDSIYLTEYPTNLQQGTASYCSRVLTGIKSVRALGGQIRRLEIEGSEITGADQNIVTPLNSLLASIVSALNTGNGATAPGWRFVTGIRTASEPHGLCVGPSFDGTYAPPRPTDLLRTFDVSGSRWFRRARESQLIQGPLNEAVQHTKGLAHPNQWSHRFVACQTLRALQLSNLGWQPRDRISPNGPICRLD